jgi:hypothetical protein
MSKGSDHLDDLFAQLRAEPRRPASIDVTLEDRIMQEFSKTRSKRRRRVGLVTGAAAVALLVGGVGIVAAGGLEVVKGWFGKVELISPDGESKTLNIQGDEVFDGQGNAVGQLTITSGDGEQSAPGQVTVERSQHD